MVLTNVMELLKIRMRMIICWYLNMLKMEICIIIYQKILKYLTGVIKFYHLLIFQKGKVLIFYYLSIIPIDHDIITTTLLFLSLFFYWM